MPEETVNNITVGTPTPTPRTFTQEEVDKLLGQRLYEERAKYADYAELKSKAEHHDDLEQKFKDANAKISELRNLQYR